MAVTLSAGDLSGGGPMRSLSCRGSGLLSMVRAATTLDLADDRRDLSRGGRNGVAWVLSKLGSLRHVGEGGEVDLGTWRWWQ